MKIDDKRPEMGAEFLNHRLVSSNQALSIEIGFGVSPAVNPRWLHLARGMCRRVSPSARSTTPISLPSTVQRKLANILLVVQYAGNRP